MTVSFRFSCLLLPSFVTCPFSLSLATFFLACLCLLICLSASLPLPLFVFYFVCLAACLCLFFFFLSPSLYLIMRWSTLPTPLSKFCFHSCRLQTPARYMGNEFGAVHKDWDAASIRFCLTYPEVYEVSVLVRKISYSVSSSAAIWFNWVCWW